MKTVGETLKAAREKQKLDLGYISEILKIRVKYLEALENGNYELFPSALYIKGFLKNYAKFLGLNQDQILALYRREYTVSSQDSHPSFLPYTPKLRMITFALKPNVIISILTALVLAGIALYLFYEFKQFNAAPALNISYPIDNQLLNTDTVTITGKTDVGDKVFVDGAQILSIDNTGSFSTTISLHPDLNQINITSQNALNKSTTVVRHVIYSATQSSNPSNANTLYAVIAVSHDKTWVKISADNTVVLQDVLDPQTTKNISANHQLVIQTGNSANVSVSVNGVHIPLTQDGATTYNTITESSSGNLTIQ